MSDRQDAYVGVPPLARERALGDVRLTITSLFDVKWFRIAVEHERAVIEARDRAKAARDDREWGVAIEDELKAAMVAIAAAAFAIDAMYRKLDDMLGVADRSRAKTDVGRIVQTFKIALDLGKRDQAWQSSIPALFKLRGELVHFRGEPHETVMHPTGRANVARENVTYTAEATRAVDLALEVLTTAYRSPRPKHAAIVKWSKSAANVPSDLESLRHAR